MIANTIFIYPLKFQENIISANIILSEANWR